MDGAGWVLFDELESLRVENAALKAKLAVESHAAAHWMKEANDEHNKNVRLEAKLAEAERQRDEYKADAERYRFIRDEPYTPEIQRVMMYQQNALMDAAIDAALAAKSGEEGK